MGQAWRERWNVPGAPGLGARNVGSSRLSCWRLAMAHQAHRAARYGCPRKRLYQNGLPDRTNYEQVYERGLLVKLIEQWIEEEKGEDIRLVLSLLRQGYTWD